MKKVGLIGWRGMVGSVLVQRMRDEGDFALIEPTFFSTQSGLKAPEIGKPAQMQDSNNIAALTAMDILISCQGGDYTTAIHPQLRAAGWNGYWIDAAKTLRMKDDAVIILDPVNMLQGRIADRVQKLCEIVDAVILMDQVDIPETGVVTRRVLETIQSIVEGDPRLLVIADSRRGLRGYPPVCLKMNAAELSEMTGTAPGASLKSLQATAANLAREQGRAVFVTLAERGIIGVKPEETEVHVAALPVRGEIDIVGAGDSVTANLTAALAAGADIGEACAVAMTASSIVIHQLGTTGTASVPEISNLLHGDQ